MTSKVSAFSGFVANGHQALQNLLSSRPLGSGNITWVTIMEPGTEIGFLDKVRIRSTDATEAAGVAGLVGEVSGFTTPFHTELPVIGVLKDDFAVGVLFDDRDDTLWFAPDLLDVVDRTAGTVIQVGKLTYEKTSDGGWELLHSPRNPLGWLARLLRVFRKRG